MLETEILLSSETKNKANGMASDRCTPFKHLILTMKKQRLTQGKGLAWAWVAGDFATSTSCCSFEADELPFSPMCSAEAKVKNAMT